MNVENKNPIIFMVSGIANSGKDTTCELINNYVKLKNLKSVNLQFSYYIKMYAKELTSWDGNDETKPRTLLQQIGTDVIRKNIDDMFFVNRIIDDIKVYSFFCDVITISDTRFPIEIESVYNSFSNVVRINIIRPDFENNLNSKERKHITETALDGYNSYDYTLVNDGTIEDLNYKVINIVNEVLNNEKVN